MNTSPPSRQGCPTERGVPCQRPPLPPLPFRLAWTVLLCALFRPSLALLGMIKLPFLPSDYPWHTFARQRPWAAGSESPVQWMAVQAARGRGRAPAGEGGGLPRGSARMEAMRRAGGGSTSKAGAWGASVPTPLCSLQAMAYVLSANMDTGVPDYKLEAAISKIFASVSGFPREGLAGAWGLY